MSIRGSKLFCSLSKPWLLARIGQLEQRSLLGIRPLNLTAKRFEHTGSTSIYQTHRDMILKSDRVNEEDVLPVLKNLVKDRDFTAALDLCELMEKHQRQCLSSKGYRDMALIYKKIFAVSSSSANLSPDIAKRAQRAANELLFNMQGKKPDATFYENLIRTVPYSQAMDLFQDMLFRGIAPTEVVYFAVLNACAKAGFADCAYDTILMYLSETGYSNSGRCFELATKVLSDNGDFERVSALLSKRKPTSEMHANFVIACLNANEYNRALRALGDVLPKANPEFAQYCGVEPTFECFFRVIQASVERKQWDIALGLFAQMLKDERRNKEWLSKMKNIFKFLFDHSNPTPTDATREVVDAFLDTDIIKLYSHAMAYKLLKSPWNINSQLPSDFPATKFLSLDLGVAMRFSPTLPRRIPVTVALEEITTHLKLQNPFSPHDIQKHSEYQIKSKKGLAMWVPASEIDNVREELARDLEFEFAKHTDDNGEPFRIGDLTPLFIRRKLVNQLIASQQQEE